MYIDMVFAVNTIMDMMVLTILNRVLLYGTAERRILARVVIDGIWSCVVSLAPDTLTTVEILGTYVVVSSLIAITAYRLKSPKEVIKSVTGIYLVSMVLGGVMLMSYEHTRAGYYVWLLVEAGYGRKIPAVIWFLMIAGAAAVCYGLSGEIKELIRTMAHGEDLCGATTIYGERKETITGFMDTDNRLGEPMSSQPVHVAAAGLMKQLCPTVKGVVHAPYQPVGTTSGTLPAVSIDRMEIEQKGGRYSLKKPFIVITKQELSSPGEYQILTQKSD